jgi:hypothetical protein
LPVRSATSPPNIVFILADDLSCYGSKYYETPNIDRWAAQGLKFTSGYTSIQNSSPGANRSTAQCLQRIPLLQKPIQKRNSQKIPTGIEDGSECVFV